MRTGVLGFTYTENNVSDRFNSTDNRQCIEWVVLVYYLAIDNISQVKWLLNDVHERLSECLRHKNV